MSIRMIAFALVVVMAFLGGMMWQKQAAKPSPSGTEQSTLEPQGEPGASDPSPVVGAPSEQPPLAWTTPPRWKTLGERPMRIATYSVPGTGGGEDAECAVFYFGPSQGGGVDPNIERWVSQFENARSPERATQSVNGFTVHRVQVAGDYLAPSGPMMQSSGTKPGYMLIGAIVDDPAGAVFFKLTGPEKTVKAAAPEFDRMLKSLRKS